MKHPDFFARIFLTVGVAACFCVNAGVGESAVITLVFPSGARSCGMGEVGTALADDANVGFFNPAGLGEYKESWRKLSATGFYEPLLPRLIKPSVPLLGPNDLWHFQTALIVQPQFLDIGGFALDFNYINMGRNEWTDELGRILGKAHSYESVISLSWGADFFSIRNHYLGLSVKLINSVLAPAEISDEGTATSVAFDAGYLALLPHGFRLGINVQNMGPSVFYVRKENSDPIPFTLNCAIAYKDTFSFIDIAAETRLDREFVKSHTDGSPDPFYKALFTSAIDEPFIEELQQINIHTGLEVGVWQRGFVRTGLLFDYIGERYEWNFGLGGRPMPMMQIDWSYIHAPEGMMRDFLRHFDRQKEGATGVRDGQWRFSVTYLNSPIGLIFDIAKAIADNDAGRGQAAPKTQLRR